MLQAHLLLQQHPIHGISLALDRSNLTTCTFYLYQGRNAQLVHLPELPRSQICAALNLIWHHHTIFQQNQSFVRRTVPPLGEDMFLDTKVNRNNTMREGVA